MLSLIKANPDIPALCKHCGTPLASRTVHGGGFCCAGCQFVHELISSQGLDRFYDLQNAALPPAPSHVFGQRDYSWLAARAAEAEQTGEARLVLDLQGISCLGCVWLIERLFHRQPGALAVEVAPASGSIEFRWVAGECDLAAFAGELQRFGYLLGPKDAAVSPASSDATTTGAMRPLVRRMGLCGAFAMNAMLFSVPVYFGMRAEAPAFPIFMRLAFVFATLSFVTGGSYFFARAWHGLRAGALHLDLPISLGLIAAYAGSIHAWIAGATNFIYFEFVSTFTFLMLVGRWVQQRAVEKNRNRLLSSRADPGEVLVPTPAGPEKIPATRLEKGIVYKIAPGHLIPVRSRLRSSAATLGLEWINGESEARLARAGELLPSGAVNCSQSSIELEATEAWSSSVLASLLEIRPRMHRNSGLERFLRAYIGAVLVVGALGFVFWIWRSGDLLQSLQVLTSILVVSCPCAAGVALPLADELATERLRRAGVFVREQSLWARILKVRRILFDKTGTLTLERLALANPEALAALSSDEQAVLLALVYDSFHPASACLREVLLAGGVVPVAGVSPKEVVGFGLELSLGGMVWRLGRPGWHTGMDSDETPAGLSHDAAFSRDGRVLARFRFCEEARPDAPEEVAALQGEGHEIYILSGDRPGKVEALAERLGIRKAHCQGGMTPQEKAAWIRTGDRHDTLMIGDGANDSLAFNESFCTGTPAVDRGLLEHKADFYFLGRGLGGVRRLFAVARQRQRAGRRVVLLSLAYNVAAVALCLHGSMNPIVAAVIMPISSLASLAVVFGSFRGR